MIRVTQLIGRYKRPFDAPKMARRVAERDGLSYQDVLKSWDRKRDNACRRGNVIHSMIENGKVHRWPLIAQLLGNADHVEFECTQFVPEWGLRGTFDCLIDEKHMFDWKTGKEIIFDHPWGSMKAPVSELDDCIGNHYGIQQGMYSLMLKKLRGIEVETCTIVHINKQDEVTFYPLEARFWMSKAQKILDNAGLTNDDISPDVGF